MSGGGLEDRGREEKGINVREGNGGRMRRD